MAPAPAHDYLSTMQERAEAHGRLSRHDIHVKHVYRVVSAGDSDIYYEGNRCECILYVAHDDTPMTAVILGPDSFSIRSGW